VTLPLVCSLKVDGTPQLIQPDRFTIVHFPFGVAEPTDVDRMHQAAQPDGHQVLTWTADDRSGLIWPAAEGWGVLTSMIQWESGGYSQLSDRYVRDPLDLTTGWDATATDERPPSPGRQRFTKTHQMYVHPGTPVALEVAHNGDTALELVLAEFKLAIHI